MVDSPYPELKKSATMARTGRPWRDSKPPPATPVWAVIQGFGNYWLLVAALELGIFDTLSDAGPQGADALARRLGASALHLQGVLDGLVVLGLLDQCRDLYTLNETAERYLTTGGAASMAALVAVAPGPRANWEALSDTVRRGRPATPVEDDPAAFYRPLVEATFATQLRAARRLDNQVGYSSMTAPRVLDLGAGGAPWSIAILEACAGGRAVVNDLPGVLDVAARRLAEHGVADRAELRPGDYRSVPLERGAFDIVVLGHVCRAEARDGARALIGRAFDALAPAGRLLLVDYLADNGRKHNPFGVLMGVTMLTATARGAPVTAAQVHGWLTEAGFASIRLVEPITSTQVYVATKGSGEGRGE